MSSFRARALAGLLGISSVAACSAPKVTTPAGPTTAHAGTLAVGELRKSGTVHLAVTCKDDVARGFDTSLALLHSFFYEEARRRFRDLAAHDPGCAMAYWGIAMTYYHPLWAPPTPEEMEQGKKAAREAKAHLAGTTDLERGFVDAIDAFYRTEDDAVVTAVAQSCHGPREHGARAAAFEQSLANLAQRHPDELEAVVFHALAMLATAPPTDKTYAQQLRATAILEPLFAKHADHPGIAHYLIHGYDYPELAARALPAARHYADVAPWVPHALHMPSHIYTRLGMWPESIEANVRSSNAAREYASRVFDGAAWSEDLHSLDYLTFAYLQTARDDDAAAVVDHVRSLAKIYDPVFSAAYAIAAIPARFALERGRWKDAVELPVLRPEVMKAFPFALAHTEFAHAIGAARSGDPARAREAVAHLATLRDSLQEPKFRWWTSQVEIQRLAGAGWTALAEGNDAEAERQLRAAAKLEDEAGTHPVTPGQILPAYEQLGDFFTTKGRAAEALTAYEQSLRAFPNRLSSHLGAARAAEAANRPDAARAHYQQAVTMAGRGTGRREEIAAARAYLDRARR